jgi:hypothetical protein
MIKAGDKFKCIKDVVLYESEMNYIKGKTYTSDIDGCITNEKGQKDYWWSPVPEEFAEHFERVHLADLNPPKINYVADATLLPPNYVITTNCCGGECCKEEETLEEGNPVIREVYENLHELLQYKNIRYGNSSLEPINVFSKVDATTGLLQRIDDKVARIKNSPDLRKNDVVDLIGYLTLLCVSKGWTNFEEFKD